MGVCSCLASFAAVLVGLVGPGGQPRPSPAPAARPHVVVLIMDEFPGDHMLGRGSRIDAVRFPALARLASRSHWFPNASTWSPATAGGVPAILDARRPRWGAAPTRREHPASVYDTLGRAGYRIVNSEETTALCPRRLCARLAVPAPPCRATNCRFIDPGRLDRFNFWLRTIRPRAGQRCGSSTSLSPTAPGRPALGAADPGRRAHHSAAARTQPPRRPARQVRAPAQLPASSAPAPLRRPTGRQARRSPRSPADVGPHASGGHERPRLLVHRRRGRAPPAGGPQRPPARPGAADDQAARAASGAARRRLRRQRRRDPHDRRRAQYPARLRRRRRVGLRRVRRGTPDVRPRRPGGPVNGRLRGPTSGLERAAPRAVRLGAPWVLGRDRPQPPPGGRRVARGRGVAPEGCERRSSSPNACVRSGARPGRCRSRFWGTCTERAPGETSRWRSTAASRRWERASCCPAAGRGTSPCWCRPCLCARATTAWSSSSPGG